jgi:L-serine dehydratase
MDKISERISVLDIFKIGIGPSSSHTMGPWKAAQIFIADLESANVIDKIKRIRINLYGALAKTGKGHGTGMAVILGLSGYDPRSIKVQAITEAVNSVRASKKLQLGGKYEISFGAEEDIVFHRHKRLSFHPNGISFEALTHSNHKIKNTFYSIGGGFIVNEDISSPGTPIYDFPYPIDSAKELLHWTNSTNNSVAQIVRKNELSLKSDKELVSALFEIWETMAACMYKGCHTEGILPGGLNVKRRSHTINKHLLPEDASSNFTEWMAQIKSRQYSFNEILKWVSCFAIAVNEENASFGRVVTAPTNGAAGVIPAVLMYYLCFVDQAIEDHIIEFLLVAGEMGSIFKKGSTISAAMGGCQAEIGVSSAMAAAALTECLGGKPGTVLMAAEIAMEHHLGLTCDPVGGLVQIPCIERNSMGAVKAITAAYLALEGDPDSAKVSLDGVIKTMWDTAQDMNSKYKETSDGGLAVNIPVNFTDC